MAEIARVMTNCTFAKRRQNVSIVRTNILRIIPFQVMASDKELVPFAKLRNCEKAVRHAL